MPTIEYRNEAATRVREICAANGCIFANPVNGNCARVSCYADIYYSLAPGSEGCAQAAISVKDGVQVGTMISDGFVPDDEQVTMRWLEALTATTLPSST